ncbi:MAG TPA: TonB-dependent receptor [Bacteroidia bacterium]|nr:TonB-dependent receptor [Bacteroidia bacterium]
MRIFLTAFLFFISGYFAGAQNVISGVIKDGSSGETLIGATVVIKGTTEGAATDIEGKFSFETTRGYPLVLLASFVGFLNQEITLNGAQPLTIKLKKNEVLLKNVTVTGSRISEKQKESPITVEALDYIAIKETPAAGFYEGLGQLKGVDLTSASLGFKIINTRGFNSSSPVRSLQLIDGVDNQSPGLNFSLGNFLGSSELDVQKVDLIVGASSAYYGPNAFNGVIALTTRSPFESPGLQFMVKIGDRKLNEFALRFAQVFKNKKGDNKFAYKLNFYRFTALDWKADNYSPTEQSRNTSYNPGGYDAVNVYGDEDINGTDYKNFPGAFPGLMSFNRKGYREEDLVDYNSNNTKAGLALHYMITPMVEVIASSNYGTGTTIYQGDNRYSLKNIKFLQNRVEVREKDKWFVRAYSTSEDAGQSYDAYFTALLLQRSAKSDGHWKNDYENFWNGNYNLSYIRKLPGFPPPPGFGPAYVQWLQSVNPFLLNNYYDSLVYYHQQAQAYASGVGNPQNQNLAFFEPGTARFDSAFNAITSRKSYSEGGSRFYDKSKLYHIQGEYHYSFKWVEGVVGGNYRLYKPNSDGTIFSDTSYVHYNISANSDTLSIDTLRNKLSVYEFGVYAGLEKKILKDKLKLNATVRLDKNQNFNMLVSPAGSVVYTPNNNHVIRVSFSSAVRNPTLTDQYLFYQVGRATLLGNINGYTNLLTPESVTEFYDSSKSSFKFLNFFNVDPVRPEKVKTIEAGYRATLFNRLYVDLNGYYSWYHDFIGYQIGVDADTFSINTFGGTIYDLVFNRVVRVASNAQSEVTTQGVSVGLNYYIGKYFAFTGNYSWNKLNKKGTDDPLIPAFNTPENKYNIGFNGRDIKGVGFNINYKWVQGFKYEGSPQFTGEIPSYDMVDAQVNYHLKDAGTTFKLGAMNLFNNKHYEIYGGPKVGRMVYFSILFEVEKL